MARKARVISALAPAGGDVYGKSKTKRAAPFADAS